MTLYRKRRGVAGQISVTYAGGETATTHDGAPFKTTSVEFVGSTYGDGYPIVMVQSSGAQTFVKNPDRFGIFSDDPIAWAKRFVGLEEA